MLQKFKQMQPKRKLKYYTISFLVLASILLIMVMTSLSIVASNLMVTDELSTSNELKTLKQEHSSYLISQRMIVSFDVICLIFLPLLMFSVFKFYTTGNLIIIILNAIVQAARWISAVVFMAGDSQLKQTYANLFASANYGQDKMCKIQTCGQGLLNYVVCARLQLWRETEDFQFGFSIVGIPLVVGVLILAYATNRLDLKLVQFSESTD